MKSTREQLLNRGFAFDEDIAAYQKYSEHELLHLLKDKETFKRTIAIKLLSKNPNPQHIPVFCEMLKTGEKLYTKLELQKALAEHGEKAIPILVPLLGAVGNNQHKKPAIVDLNKKSYPCPRDIIAMILIRIGPAVFSELSKLLSEDKNKKQIHEALDVIGHITWNYRDYSMEKPLLDYYNKHKSDEFIRWKIIRAFQSFNSKTITKILSNIIKENENNIIVEEAKRSLSRILHTRTESR